MMQVIPLYYLILLYKDTRYNKHTWYSVFWLERGYLMVPRSIFHVYVMDTQLYFVFRVGLTVLPPRRDDCRDEGLSSILAMSTCVIHAAHRQRKTKALQNYTACFLCHLVAISAAILYAACVRKTYLIHDLPPGVAHFRAGRVLHLGSWRDSSFCFVGDRLGQGFYNLRSFTMTGNTKKSNPLERQLALGSDCLLALTHRFTLTAGRKNEFTTQADEVKVGPSLEAFDVDSSSKNTSVPRDTFFKLDNYCVCTSFAEYVDCCGGSCRVQRG